MQIMYNTPGAYFVQDVMCHMVRRGSSAIKFDRVESKSHLFTFILLARTVNR